MLDIVHTQAYTEEQLFNIARKILERYELDCNGIHGINHWGRVLETGSILAGLTGANLRIVQLFALFHDSRRQSDGQDPHHGMRGAALAAQMNGTWFTLSMSELALLQDACTRHTMGLIEADITIQSCWDADRLDLPRVGIYPLPERLCTEPARSAKFMKLAIERSTENYQTPFTRELQKSLI